MAQKLLQRSIKFPTGLQSQKYEDRCISPNLTSLKAGRIRGELVQKFKLENYIELIE